MRVSCGVLGWLLLVLPAGAAGQSFVLPDQASRVTLTVAAGEGIELESGVRGQQPQLRGLRLAQPDGWDLRGQAAHPGRPAASRRGDVTGDGKLDLVATGLDDMWVLEGLGDGTFGPSQRFAGGGDSLVLEDLDGNGTLDAVSIRGGVQVLPHL